MSMLTIQPASRPKMIGSNNLNPITTASITFDPILNGYEEDRKLQVGLYDTVLLNGTAA